MEFPIIILFLNFINSRGKSSILAHPPKCASIPMGFQKIQQNILLSMKRIPSENLRRTFGEPSGDLLEIFGRSCFFLKSNKDFETT